MPAFFIIGVPDMAHLPYGVGHDRRDLKSEAFLWLKIGFIGLFILVIGGMFAYDHFIREPRLRCEKSGNWWSPKDGHCATVVYTPVITGRAAPNGTQKPRILWPDMSDHERTAGPPPELHAARRASASAGSGK